MPVFTPDEIARIENLKMTENADIINRFKYLYLFQLLAHTGCRIGEALALTWKNVDMDKSLIHVSQSLTCVKNRSTEAEKKYAVQVTSVKTKQGNRTIPCNEKAMEALVWFKEHQEKCGLNTEFVFSNDIGLPLSQSNLPRNLKVVLKAADVPYKNIHAFRHAFATNLIDAGADIKTVSYLMGHSSVKVTMDTYVHTNLDRAIEAVERLSK